MLAAYDTTSVGREIASMAPKDAVRVLALLSAQDKGSLLSELSLAGLLDEAREILFFLEGHPLGNPDPTPMTRGHYGSSGSKPHCSVHEHQSQEALAPAFGDGPYQRNAIAMRTFQPRAALGCAPGHQPLFLPTPKLSQHDPLPTYPRGVRSGSHPRDAYPTRPSGDLWRLLSSTRGMGRLCFLPPDPTRARGVSLSKQALSATFRCVLLREMWRAIPKAMEAMLTCMDPEAHPLRTKPNHPSRPGHHPHLLRRSAKRCCSIWRGTR